MLTLDFSYGENFSNDEGDKRAHNKMLLIIIGRNQRAAHKYNLENLFKGLAKRQREKYNESSKMSKLAGYMKNVNS